MFENIDKYLNVIDMLEKNQRLKSSAIKVIPTENDEEQNKRENRLHLKIDFI